MTPEKTKSTSKEKRDTLERFLVDEHVLVHIAPKFEGVVVPEHLASSPTVTLKLSRYFRGKLEISADLVTAELLFGQEYFKCQLPFGAIWGVTSVRGQFLMWPESAPEEVLAGLEKQSQARQSEALAAEPESVTSAETTKSKRPQLRRVK